MDGWTKAKVKKLLVNPKMEITYRIFGFNEFESYYAVYKNSGKKAFKKSEIDKHTFDDLLNFGGTDWYIDKEK